MKNQAKQEHQQPQQGGAPPDPARVAEVPPHVAAVLEGLDLAVMKRVRQLRGARSQRVFARELGVFQQNVNRYENGTVPHAYFLVHLYLIEGVDLNWLLLGIGDPYRDRKGFELPEVPTASKPGPRERPVAPRAKPAPPPPPAPRRQAKPPNVDMARYLPPASKK